MKQQLAFKSTYLRENCYISGAIVNVALAKHVLGNVDISIIKHIVLSMRFFKQRDGKFEKKTVQAVGKATKKNRILGKHEIPRTGGVTRESYLCSICFSMYGTR